MSKVLPHGMEVRPTNDPFTRKLEHFVTLTSREREALSELSGARLKRLEARSDVIREGEKPRNLHVLVQGWACRYKMLPDGRRQILGLLIPGDAFDYNIHLLGRLDHSVAAVTPITCLEVPVETVETLFSRHKDLERALQIDALACAAIQREWVLNLGQRTASERIAHLFCEMFHRQKAVGLARGMTCQMPMTQSTMGEASGLSYVHVNRTLQELRRAGLVELRSGELEILDLDSLMELAMFNPAYLHFRAP